MTGPFERTAHHRRIVIVGVVIGLTVFVLFTRLWYLQVTRNEYYLDRAERNRLRVVAVPAPRGLITDRHGQALVENELAFTLILYREFIQDRERLIDRLERTFGLEQTYVQEKWAEFRRVPVVLPITLKSKLSFEEIAFVEAHRLSFPELSLDPAPSRRYLHGEAAAHILGYVGEVTRAELAMPQFSGLRPGDVIGKSGLERQYNRHLTGRKGMLRYTCNSIGQRTGVLEEIPPTKGEDLNLSIDLGLQLEANRLMEGHKGSVVAIDPVTGEVLCLVSRPAYDPNVFSNLLTTRTWQAMTEDPDRPLQNKPIQGMYPPGSVYKILVALAAMGEGYVGSQTTHFCAGQVTLLGRTVRCWNSGGHGNVRLREAITNSCNVFFYHAGLQLGVDRIHHWSNLAGFGIRTGIDLPGERAGLIPSSQWKQKRFGEPWYPGETLSVAIGQGAVSVTPLQVALFMAAVGTNRRPPIPTLLRTPASSSVAPAEAPALFPEGPWADVVRGMVDVVESGTGRRAKLPGILIAGKTGTSQVISSATAERLQDYTRRFREHSWFSCFAPVESPRIALAVLVEHAGHGSAVAAPIAAGIMHRFFHPDAPPWKLEKPSEE